MFQVDGLVCILSLVKILVFFFFYLSHRRDIIHNEIQIVLFVVSHFQLFVLFRLLFPFSPCTLWLVFLIRLVVQRGTNHYFWTDIRNRRFFRCFCRHLHKALVTCGSFIVIRKWVVCKLLFQTNFICVLRPGDCKITLHRSRWNHACALKLLLS